MTGPEQRYRRFLDLVTNPYPDLTIINTQLIEKDLQKDRRCSLPSGTVVALEGVGDERLHVDMGFLEITEPVSVMLIGIGTNLPLKASPSVVAASFDFDLNALKSEADMLFKRFRKKNSPPWVLRITPIEMFFLRQGVTVDFKKEGFSPEGIKGFHLIALLSQYPRLQEPVSSVSTRFRR